MHLCVVGEVVKPGRHPGLPSDSGYLLAESSRKDAALTGQVSRLVDEGESR